MRLLVAGLEAEEVHRLFGPIEDRVSPEGILPDWNQLEAAVDQFRPEAIGLFIGDRPGQIGHVRPPERCLISGDSDAFISSRETMTSTIPCDRKNSER